MVTGNPYGFALPLTNPKTSGCDCIVDFYSLISDFFQRHLETTSLAVDALAEATGTAVEQAAEAILNERKLFSIGLGADCAGATALASLLHCGVLRERPSLPVVELAEHHIESVETGVNWAGQQIQALGQLGDVAFVFAASLGGSSYDAANRRCVADHVLFRRGAHHTKLQCDGGS